MSTHAPEKQILREPPDFSLVLGGPLYQLLRRTHLAGNAMQLVGRRVTAFILVAWVPLLVLSAVEGHLWGAWAETKPLPFLHDIDLHARMLLSVPLLIIAEMVVHQRARPVVRQFLDRGLLTEVSRPKFEAAIESAMRLRNSIAAELLLIAIVYVVGVGLVWRTQVALDIPCWYGEGVKGTLHPTLAGWWMGVVSLPLFQFLLLRWYFRIFIWARFLWQVSRLELKLIPTHPDRCAGLGFLSSICYAFSPLLLAQGAALAGLIANRIFFMHETLVQFKYEIGGLAAVMVLVVLIPLLVFAPVLQAVKRDGLLEYGGLAQRYVREFDRKWIRGGVREDEALVGSGDIQSLADLSNSFEVVRGIRPAPFTMQAVLQLAVTTLLPVAPLALTMISFEQLLGHVMKLVF